MTKSSNQFDSVPDAIAAIAAGEMVIVVDDDDRENEGDLIMAASKATGEAAAFMIRHTSGILCTPVTQEIATRLQLNLMVANNEAPMGTAFTVTIDYKHGLSTGISADERATTAQALTNSNVKAEDFLRPGHMFPLIAHNGGVLIRGGHTEAAVDLATLAGLEPVGLLSELVNDDGSVQRLPGLIQFARAHSLKIISIADLVEYRQANEDLMIRTKKIDIETKIGTACAHLFKTKYEGSEFVALVFGDVTGLDKVSVCVHKDKLIEDMFNTSSEGDSLAAHFQKLKQTECGVLIYQRSENLAEALGEEVESSREAVRRQRWLREGVTKQILAHLNIDRYSLEIHTPDQQETTDLF